MMMIGGHAYKTGPCGCWFPREVLTSSPRSGMCKDRLDSVVKGMPEKYLGKMKHLHLTTILTMTSRPMMKGTIRKCVLYLLFLECKEVCCKNCIISFILFPTYIISYHTWIDIDIHRHTHVIKYSLRM